MYKFLIPLFALALLAGCNPTETTTTPEPSTDTPSDIIMDDTNEPNPGMKGFNGDILKGDHDIILHTSMGDVELTLNADAAPKTVTNFVVLAQTGYYDALTFHRIIPDFMVQAGDPNGNGTGGDSIYGESFEDEINAKSYNLHKKDLKEVVGDQQIPPELEGMTVKDFYETQGYVYNDDLDSLPMEYGAIAMANRGPNTNGSQFFIITRKDGTDWLEGKHTVFGKVTKGMDIVEQIAAVDRDPSDKPNEPITYTVEVVK